MGPTESWPVRAQVIPGSHKPGVIYPSKVHADPSFDSAPMCYGYPYSDADWVPVELAPGDGLLFNGYLIHKSTPNQCVLLPCVTSGPRRFELRTDLCPRCVPSLLPASTEDKFRRAFANHYMSAASFLPWTNDNRLSVKPEEDMRDVVMVAGADPYVVPAPSSSCVALEAEALRLSVT